MGNSMLSIQRLCYLSIDYSNTIERLGTQDFEIKTVYGDKIAKSCTHVKVLQACKRNSGKSQLIYHI